MVHIFTTLINVLAVALNVPGMLDGRPIAIGSGIFCAVALGITGTLGVLTWSGRGA